MSTQLSDGDSSYNAMNLELKKRFSGNMQSFAMHHLVALDPDSSDLQTLLKPQNNRKLHSRAFGLAL